MELTPEQKETYISNRGMNCPVCESMEVECDNHDFDDNLVYGDCTCNSCGLKYTDVYRLVDVIIY